MEREDGSGDQAVIKLRSGKPGGKGDQRRRNLMCR